MSRETLGRASSPSSLCHVVLNQAAQEAVRPFHIDHRDIQRLMAATPDPASCYGASERLSAASRSV